MTQAPFGWRSATLSDVGKVRGVNEDACLDLPERGVWVVADGMGGHQAGDLASRMIVEAMQGLGSHAQPSALVDDIEDCLLRVNRELYEKAHAAAQPMTIGSTVVVLVAIGEWVLCLWAGDSRAYRLRAGRLERVTHDHSQIEEMIRTGELRPEEAEHHPLASVITRAVGGSEELFLDLELTRLCDGDRYLLCTDGLYKDLDDSEIAAALVTAGGVLETCKELVRGVLARKAQDNVTVAVIDFNVQRTA